MRGRSGPKGAAIRPSMLMAHQIGHAPFDAPVTENPAAFHDDVVDSACDACPASLVSIARTLQEAARDITLAPGTQRDLSRLCEFGEPDPGIPGSAIRACRNVRRSATETRRSSQAGSSPGPAHGALLGGRLCPAIGLRSGCKQEGHRQCQRCRQRRRSGSAGDCEPNSTS